MNVDGTELATLYALPPNQKGYCGPASFQEAAVQHFNHKTPSTLRVLEQQLKKFDAHHAYLALIAQANSLTPLDLEVVKAFWIGSPMLEKVSPSQIKAFIKTKLLPDQPERVERLAENLPDGLTPHHSFNALYVNFVTNKVEKTMENYDACCVSAGKVISTSDQTIEVKRSFITMDEKKFALKEKTQTVTTLPTPIQFPQLQKNDVVSIHWNTVIQKITARDANAIRHYTQKNINAINSQVARGFSA